MFTRMRRWAVAGLLGCLSAGAARADGDIEKPPGVPPEVQAAKSACPTLHGPCHGFYPTRWRVLGDCGAPPAAVIAVPSRAPTSLPPTPRAVPNKAPAKPDSPSKLQPVAGCGTFLIPDEVHSATILQSRYNQQSPSK